MTNILMLLAALSLSAIAAFYSIAGLAAIFAAAVTPIIVMGSVLEVSKLVLASWLYHNWVDLPKLMKSYFLVAVIILMSLTSMGIFGYLSKAHLDQAVPTGDVQAKVSLIEEKIKQEKDIINESRATLAQLDKQVNETISRTANQTDTKGIERSVTIRKQQAKERKQLYDTISTAQAEVAKLQQEKAPLASQVRKIEAEVGPIKYIAQLIYGDRVDETLLEKAVRIVILMIVSVFDPLAVLMLVGYNWTLKNARKEDEPKPEGWTKEWVPKSEQWPPYDPEFIDPLPDELIDNIRREANVDENIKMEGLFDEEPTEKTKEDWDPSFLKIFEGEDTIPSPPPPTIEQEVEQLQQQRKPIEYDSAGRRITP